MNHSTSTSTFTRGIRLAAAATLLALLAGLLAITPPAQANTYTVTNTNDSGAGSLRQAIADANKHAGSDTITFSKTTNGVPIVLKGASGENLNVSGDLDILDGGDLTIQGNGMGNTLISGGRIDRVFHICPAGGCTNVVTFSKLTIMNGDAIGSGGGGIRHVAGFAIVDDSALLNNSATNGGGISNFAKLSIHNGSLIGSPGNGNSAAGGNGGGLYNYGGSTVIDDSTFSANTSGNNGGAIWNQVTLVVQNSSTIGGANPSSANSADNDGGGLYNFTGGVLTVEGSTVRSNTAIVHGGGIHNRATLKVQNGTLIGGAGKGNSAEFGGGIYNQEGTATVDSATVSANTGTDGAGIHNKATLHVQNGSTIGGNGAGNTATNIGGGILNQIGGTATVTASTISANTASLFGGGILNLATLNVLDGSAIGVIGQGNTAVYGGGLYNTTGTATLENSDVISNTATIDGGGIYNDLDGQVTIDGGNIYSNTAANDGGGIHNTATLTIQNGSDLRANINGHAGAAIYNGADGVTLIENSTLRENSAYDWDGGGIYNLSGGTVTLDDSQVNDNISEDYGGGIYNDGTLKVLNGSAVSGNTSLLDNGGGIYNDDDGNTTVDASAINDNTASDYGGGIYNKGRLKVQNGSSIGAIGAGNTARWGGGIYSDYGGEVTVDGSSITGNWTSAASANGGGIFSEENLSVENGSTIQANTATRDGGGIYSDNTLTVLNDVTIRGNSAVNEGGGIYIYGTATIDGATFSANTAAKGGGIFSDGTTTVTGSRFLYNTATSQGGGLYHDWNIASATSVTGSCLVGNTAKSFFNSQAAGQIATGDWWGVPTGPNTPGADTTGGIVDTSGYLTAPILGCAPDLQVDKTNDVGGNAAVGSPFHWTLTVSNQGLVDGTFNAGQTILQDDLPPGPSYDTPAAGGFVKVINSANITCSRTGNTLTCTAAGANVTLGAEGGRFQVTLAVTPGQTGELVNPDSGGNCWVDPDGYLTESDESDNNCPADTVNVREGNMYLPLVLK